MHVSTHHLPRLLRRSRLWAPLMLLALLAGCGGGDAGSTLVPFQTLDLSVSSGISTAETAVVSAAGPWQALWARHTGPALVAPPPVDFGTRQVVAVFLGGRASTCQTVNIVAIRDDETHREVRYVEHVPGPAELCVAQAGTPAHLVSVPRSALPVVFVAGTS